MYHVVRNTKDLIVLLDKTTFRARKITYEDLYEMLNKGSCHIDNLSSGQELAFREGKFKGVAPQEYFDGTELKILNYQERQSCFSHDILPIYFDYTIIQRERHNFISNDFCVVTIGDSHHVWCGNSYVILSTHLVNYIFKLEDDVLYVTLPNQGNLYSLYSMVYAKNQKIHTRQEYLERMSLLKRQDLTN